MDDNALMMTKLGLHVNQGSRDGYGAAASAGPAAVTSLDETIKIWRTHHARKQHNASGGVIAAAQQKCWCESIHASRSTPRRQLRRSTARFATGRRKRTNRRHSRNQQQQRNTAICYRRDGTNPHQSGQQQHEYAIRRDRSPTANLQRIRHATRLYPDLWKCMVNLTTAQLQALIDLANRAPKTSAEQYALQVIVDRCNAQLRAQKEENNGDN